jgi:hypothetical protein
MGCRLLQQPGGQRPTGYPAGGQVDRLVGILHGCLKTGTTYDETIAWGHLHLTP